MKKIFKTYCLVIISCFVVLSASARDGVAVVIDAVSYKKARTELDDYVYALEKKQNYKVYIVIDKWQVPDSIRTQLISLHEKKRNAIVGAVLIGDIPIPMVRDAQHLTSAFKMDQSKDRRESSVPSDRFYDDFGLKFKSLGKDAELPYWYYSLSADGHQRVCPDIFSGRIRPTDAGGVSRYDKLRAYLRKATATKTQPEKMSSVFVFTGDGSISESKPAHIDEFRGLMEHFPQLSAIPNAFSYMDYNDATPIRFRMMDELMRPDLSLAVLHHHGDWDTQYLNMRSSDNLTIDDFAKYKFRPNARCVVFDACFNGSFHRDDCIANQYIFSSGATVATLAGSVNIIQDKWYDHYLGLLACSKSIGYINQHTAYLESHVIGDPTFAFIPTPPVKGSADLLCHNMLEHTQRYNDQTLLHILNSYPLAIVRLQAFTMLCNRKSDLIEDAIITALSDNYEMLQRFAVNMMSKSGSPKLIPAFARLLTRPNLSKRVAFNADQAIQFFDKRLLSEALEKELHAIEDHLVKPDSFCNAIRGQVEKMGARWDNDILSLCSDSLDKKHALRQAGYMRIYCPAYLLPQVADYTLRCEDNDLKKALLDVMGWHYNAYTSNICLDAAHKINADTSLPIYVREEALRTILRIEK